MTELNVNSSEIFCPSCGYNLRAIESLRCPECGLEIDRSKLGESILPWLHRQKIGRYRAFWRTVWMATVRPRMIGREMMLPARFGDAVLFRRMVVAHVAVPAGILFAAIYLINLKSGLWMPRDWLGSVFQLLAVPAGWICMTLFLFFVTGVCSYLYHPASISVERQNRAVALSYYACGPLAWTPATVGLALVAAMSLSVARYSPILLIFVGLIGFGPLLLQGVALFRTNLTLIDATTHTGVPLQIGMAIFLGVSWPVLALVFLVAVPAVLLMLALLVLSLCS